MKKKLLFSFLLIFLLNSYLQAQRLVNTAGSTITDNTTTIEYAVGEIAVTTLTDQPPGQFFFTQGLLQPAIRLNDPACEIVNDTIQYFPNPAKDILSVVTRFNWITGYQIYASDGKLVRVASFISNQIDMFNLPGGTYFIRILPGCNGKYRVLKVIKK